MQLESAFNANREGLNVHAEAINVVSDNVANSNTTGYKTARTEFSDLFASGGQGQELEKVQNVGNGVQVSAVRQIFTNGTLEPTGRGMDVGINGSGFFLVGDPANPSLTRAGNFTVNSAGLLTTSAGLPVLGTAPGGTTLTTINMNSGTAAGSATTTGSMQANINAALPATEMPAAPTSFNEVNAAATFVAPFTVYDSQGARHELTIGFFKTAANTYKVQGYINGSDVGKTDGVPEKVGTAIDLKFTENGVVDPADAANAKLTLAPAYSSGAAAGNFSIDLSKLTQYAASSTVQASSQDGQGVGNVSSVEINDAGEVIVLRDSGSSQTIATIQLGDVVNRDGLIRQGDSLYALSEDAGTLTTGNPNAGQFGATKGATLEASTVDLAQEFTGLVVYQRGYQANSQSLNAVSDLLRQTLQLIR